MKFKNIALFLMFVAFMVVCVAVDHALGLSSGLFIIAAGAAVAGTKDYHTTIPPLSMFQNAYMETDEVKYMIRHYVTSDQVNDYRQLLDPNKYVDEMYRKNPIVLYSHGGSGFFGAASVKESLEYKIGRNEKLSVTKDKGINYLLAETQFDSDSETAMSIYRLYRNKFMFAWSKYFKPIGKAKWDDENNMVVYDTWTMREYSAVDLPVDGFAVGTETYENALSLITSPIVKESFHRNAVSASLEQQYNHSGIYGKLAEFKNELESFPRISENDVKNHVSSMIKKFTDELVPKLTEMANSHNKLIDLMQSNKADIEAIAEEKCMNVFRKLMGAS